MSTAETHRRRGEGRDLVAGRAWRRQGHAEGGRGSGHGRTERGACDLKKRRSRSVRKVENGGWEVATISKLGPANGGLSQ